MIYRKTALLLYVTAGLLSLTGSCQAVQSANALEKKPAQPEAKVPVEPPPDGYALYQTSSIMGDHDVFVGPRGVKIMDRKVGMGIAATAPEWQVKCFNGTTRRIYTTTMTKYHGIEHEIRALAGGTTLKNLPFKQSKSYTADGIVINEYKTTKQFESKQEKDLGRESADPLFVKSALMETVPKSGVPRQAAVLISRFYGIPESGDLPLKFSYINLKGDLHSILVLNSARKIKTSPDNFAIPPGYTAVKELSQLEDKGGHKPFKRKVIETVKKIK